LRSVHGLLLGRASKKIDVKGNLLAFHGVVYDDDKGRDNLEAKLNRLLLRLLRQIAAFFNLDPEGEREDLVKRVADFLEKPKDTGETFKIPGESKKRSRSRSRSSSPARKKSKKDKKTGPKRNKSAFMFFCQDKRADIVKKHPDFKVTEVAKKLGAAWGKLSASDKKPYEKDAAADKVRYEKEKKKASK